VAYLFALSAGLCYAIASVFQHRVAAAAPKNLSLSPRLTASDMDVLHDIAMAGSGVALLPAFQCVEDLRARRLERVLPDWSAPSVPIHVVYPSTRYLSPKVKTFLDHLQARMTPPPWELGPAP